MGSRDRLFDDGLQDAKAGRVPLDRQLFETNVDYRIYMEGYDKGLVKPRQNASWSTYVAGSGIY